MYDRQKEIMNSVAFKGAIDIHSSILRRTGSEFFDRKQLVKSVSELTRDFIGILDGLRGEKDVEKK